MSARDIAWRLSVDAVDHLAAGDVPLMAGDDQCFAVGVWHSVRIDLEAKVGHGTRLGLVWIDARRQYPATGSKAGQCIDAMPLARLLCLDRLHSTEILCAPPKLHPDDVCLIGLRPFAWGEADLLLASGVRVFFLEEVQRRGIGEVLDEACHRVRRTTSGFGINIDLARDSTSGALQSSASWPKPARSTSAVSNDTNSKTVS